MKSIFLFTLLFIATISFEQPGWTVPDNVAGYDYDGDLNAAVILNSVNVTRGTLAAFVNGECRGIKVDPDYFGVPNAPYAYIFNLKVRSPSSSGETITFKYYDPQDNQIYDVDGTIEFVSNMQPNAMDPLVLAAIPLPIELSSFDVSIRKSNVLIEWATLSEKNVSHFDVLRSFDSKNWQTIEGVRAIGNSDQLVDYQLVDHSVKNLEETQSIVYYKLKSVDFDGHEEMSEVKSIRLQESSVEIRLFPNPVSGLLHVKGLRVDEFAQVSIFDSIGRLVYTSYLSPELDVSSLNSGAYYIQIHTSTDVFFKRFVKL